MARHHTEYIRLSSVAGAFWARRSSIHKKPSDLQSFTLESHPVCLIRPIKADYYSFLRRAATAADKAANPVPKRTTVTGSGIGTGWGGETGVVAGVGDPIAEVGVTVDPGGTVAVGPGTVAVDPGGTVAVGPGTVAVAAGTVGVAAGTVGVGGGEVGVSAASCAKTLRWPIKAGAKIQPTISKSAATKANFEAFA